MTMKALIGLALALVLASCGQASGQSQGPDCAPALTEARIYATDSELDKERLASAEAVRAWISDHVPGRPDVLSTSNYAGLRALGANDLVDVCAFSATNIQGMRQPEQPFDTMIFLVLPDDTVVLYMAGTGSNMPATTP